jgi:lysozyme
MADRKINGKGLEIIKHFEGVKLTAYKDPAGVWTIGYDVTEGLVWTEAQAIAALKADCLTAENGVNTYVTGDLTDNQFSACVSLAYNIGNGNFRNSSVLKYINANQRGKAALAFMLWVKAKGSVLPGLIRRRTVEMALFRTPPGGRSSRSLLTIADMTYLNDVPA